MPMSLPRIRIVATGGTIAGAGVRPAATASYTAAALGVGALCAAVPGLDAVARVEGEQFSAIDSKDATPPFWQRLGARLQALLDRDDADGVVVTHGTDTIEETAYYLHLALKTAKPVVLVGAMRPATALSADGPLNLLNAVVVAASPSSWGRGVLVAMNHEIHCAREVAKVNTQRPDAFASPNAGPLGLVQDGRVAWLARTDRLHTTDTPFDVGTPLPAVEVLAGYAGAAPILVSSVCDSGARGLVWAGPGSGSAGADAQVALASAAAAGVLVVRSSRTGSGYVMPGRSGDQWVYADTLSPWKARILAMLALGTGEADPARVQVLFDTH